MISHQYYYRKFQCPNIGGFTYRIKMKELAYKYNPAGQEGPKQNRQYHKPESELEKALEKYLNSFRQGDIVHELDDGTPIAGNRFYELAEEYLKTDEINPDELKSMLLPFQNHPNYAHAGFFLTAAFNASNQDLWIFDNVSEVLQRGVGTWLSEGKNLIVHSDTVQVGSLSEGLILNYGNTSNLGETAHATVINYKSAEVFGDDARSCIINFGDTGGLAGLAIGVAINFGTAGDVLSNTPLINMGTIVDTINESGGGGIIINYGEIKGRHSESNIIDGGQFGELTHYVLDIKEKLNSSRPATEILAELKDWDINQELKDLLRKGGVKWL